MLFYFHLGPYGYFALTGHIGLTDTLHTIYDAACRKIRPFYILHQFRNFRFRIVDQHLNRFDNFSQIMRRNVRGHTNRYSGGSVDKQVWNGGRHNNRLVQAVVKISAVIDGVFIDVGQQFFGKPLHPHFGVTHSRGGVAVYGAKISLAFHQRIAQRKILYHTYHTVVHSHIPVRMIFTQNFTDHTCAFFVRFIMCKPQFMHTVQYTTVHRLQTISYIRQCTRYNNRHGVVEIRLLHFVFYKNRYYSLFFGHWNLNILYI